MKCIHSRLRLFVLSLPTLFAILSLFAPTTVAADSRDDERREEQRRDDRYRDERREEDRRDERYRDEAKREKQREDARRETSANAEDRSVRPVRNLHPELQIATPRDVK